MSLSLQDADERLPQEWVLSFVAKLRTSSEWRDAMARVVLEIHTELGARCENEPLTFFSDLTPAEQAGLVSSIERGVLPHQEQYQRFCQSTSQRLHERIKAIADQRCAHAGAMRSQLSVMSDVASEGAASLLQQWPDLFDFMQALPLSTLPGPLRRQVWEMRLRHHMGNIPVYESELHRSQHDADVWDMCRDAVSILGLPALAAHVMPMKDVISHLRFVHAAGHERAHECVSAYGSNRTEREAGLRIMGDRGRRSISHSFPLSQHRKRTWKTRKTSKAAMLVERKTLMRMEPRRAGGRRRGGGIGCLRKGPKMGRDCYDVSNRC